MEMVKRNETEVFSELEELCSTPGYLHSIAYICWRDNTIKFSGMMTGEDIAHQYTHDRLLRTEISTLIGLTFKNKVNLDLPTPSVTQNYIDRTDSLLKELHQSMTPSMKEILINGESEGIDFNPFSNGNFLREPIFYSGEAAYLFQYRDFFKEKYKKDDSWFIEKKGFSIDQALEIAKSIQTIQDIKINKIRYDHLKIHPNKWSFIPAYTFTAEEVSKASNIEVKIIRKFIDSLVLKDEVIGFNSLSDFNPANAFPIIKLQNDDYLLFQIYSLMEALYETPFFWLHGDENYRSTEMEHRGEFAEEFSKERLKLVFGENRVFSNINIYTSKKKWAGEIDVLVIYGNRAIVLQAKSKKLTIEARKGNDNHLQNDFKKAVQSAYDQAYLCSTLLTDKNHRLIDKGGNELNISRNFKEIYPFCIVSEHYPALSFQARQFLKFQKTDRIKDPFVLDIFMLDVMTEMLNSPLYFLSYVNRRTTYSDKVLSTQELTILSYHLQKNLWLDDEYSMMQIDDNVCADLDVAMLARREGISGLKTPKGILTKYKNSIFDRVIKDIEKMENSNTIDLGFFLLTLGSDTIDTINKSVPKLIKLGKEDGKNHDITLMFSKMETGLTIHCNDDYPALAMDNLRNHCELRKYIQRANLWFGICISPIAQRVKFGINLDNQWAYSSEIENEIKGRPNIIQSRGITDFSTMKKNKNGRNDKCPCGSGKKFKKCCLV